MKKLVIVLFVTLLALSQWVGAVEHTINVRHNDEQIKQRIYSEAQILKEDQKIRAHEERHLKIEKQRQTYFRARQDNRLTTIQAVNIEAQSGTFYSLADYSDDFRLYGEAINRGTTAAYFVKITVNLYNASNTLLDTDTTYLYGGSMMTLSGGTFTSGLRTNESGFFIVFTSVPYANVDHYTYSFSYDTGSYTLANASLAFKGTPTFSSDYADEVRVLGEIKNTGSSYLTYFTKVIFAIYNVSGQIIDIDTTYVNGSNYNYGSGYTDTAIEPGATATFECYTDAPYAEFSTYKHAFEWDEAESQNTPVYTLTVQSSPDIGATITVSPNDNSGNGSGATNFSRTYNQGTTVTLTAPSTYNGKNFSKWTIDGADNGSASVTATMNANHAAIAFYTETATVTYTLAVQSSGTSGVPITVSPADNSGNSSGNTNFTRTYNEGSVVTLTAPLTSGSTYFSKWTVAGLDYTERTLTVTMSQSFTAVGTYAANPTTISLNRQALYFEYILGSPPPTPQPFLITNGGGGTLNWSISENYGAIECNPASGTGAGIVNILINPTGYSEGYYNGTLTITAPGAANSPLEFDVYFRVLNFDRQ
ncbi:MAG: hypothetical protein GY757_08075 [bacterium]|nr:hypothetical protein [bacterium]